MRANKICKDQLASEVEKMPRNDYASENKRSLGRASFAVHSLRRPHVSAPGCSWYVRRTRLNGSPENINSDQSGAVKTSSQWTKCRWL